METCLHCSTPLRRAQKIYCSNQCQADFRYQFFIQKWSKANDKSAVSKTKNVSRHIKRYLIEQTGERCMNCGWNKKHPLTEKVPLEVDHIDGDAENNVLTNLQLLCPNCHALTPHFRNLNKGRGRKWRK